LFRFTVPSSTNFQYEDCQQGGASYQYGNQVICYWIDPFVAPMGSHCGSYNYSWVPDSGANEVLYLLALAR